MYRIAMALILLFAATPCVLGHDLWLEPDTKEPALVFSHGEKRDPYLPADVKEAKAFDNKGNPVPVEIVNGTNCVSIAPSGQPAIITVLFEPGCRVKTPDGWQKMTKSEAKRRFAVLDSVKAKKCAKAILAPCDVSLKPVGLHFEIVPQKDPLLVKPGDTFPVKVLLDGKPVEEAVIRCGELGHSESAELPKTNKDGMADILMEKPGVQVINAAYKMPLKDNPDADVLSLSTSLSFEIK